MKLSTLGLALVAVASMTSLSACRLVASGGYAGDGVYNDDHSWGGGGSWGNDDHDSGGGSSWGGGNGGSNNTDNDRQSERDAAEQRASDNQTPNDTSDLHPPGEDRDKPPHIMSLQTALPVSNFKSTDSRVTFVAQKYDISDYAATYVVRAIELAKANDESGITDLGLTKEDFEKVLQGKKVSSEKLTALSTKLLMTEEDASMLIARIKSDVKSASK